MGLFMKKHFYFLLGALVFAALFISGCSKKAMTDDSGLFMDLDDAQKNAEKKNQDILVLITSDGDDYTSEEFIQNVLNTEAFADTIAKKYSVFHFDFSQKAYEKTIAAEDATKEEKEQAAQYAELLQTGYQFASLLDCKYTPAVFLMTKERYVICELEYEDEIMEVESFEELLTSYESKSLELRQMLDATQKGSNLERVAAIDKLYTSTPENYKPFLLDLAKTIPDLDKNNESGLCSRYIVVAAESKAISLFTKGDIVGAVQTYISACDNKYINPEERQECYYMAAYLLGSTGAEDYDLIVSYLNLALTSCPESDKVEYIRNAISYYTQQIEAKAKAAEEAQEKSNQ